MLISVRPGEPGHRTWMRVRRYAIPLVYIDGRRVHHCVSADTKRGFALVMVTDGAGAFVLTPRRDKVATQRLHGRVEVVFERMLKRIRKSIEA